MYFVPLTFALIIVLRVVEKSGHDDGVKERRRWAQRALETEVYSGSAGVGSVSSVRQKLADKANLSGSLFFFQCATPCVTQRDASGTPVPFQPIQVQ